LLAIASSYPVLILAQLLDGITGAIVTVLTVLVITDLTTGTGRFNLARGSIGTATGIGASASTIITGLIFQHFGSAIAFVAIAMIAAAATALLWIFQMESKPARYLD
jgi:MFS family permease